MHTSLMGIDQEISIFQHQFKIAEQTQEDFTDIVDAWSSKKWFIKSPVSAFLRMIRCENLQAFAVVHKSQFEQRFYDRDDEPYFGRELSTGPIPQSSFLYPHHINGRSATFVYMLMSR